MKQIHCNEHYGIYPFLSLCIWFSTTNSRHEIRVHSPLATLQLATCRNNNKHTEESCTVSGRTTWMQMLSGCEIEWKPKLFNNEKVVVLCSVRETLPSVLPSYYHLWSNAVNFLQHNHIFRFCMFNLWVDPRWLSSKSTIQHPNWIVPGHMRVIAP